MDFAPPAVDQGYKSCLMRQLILYFTVRHGTGMSSVPLNNPLTPGVLFLILVLYVQGLKTILMWRKVNQHEAINLFIFNLCIKCDIVS